MPRYLLVTGTSAAELRRCTGLDGVDTTMGGVLVERPIPMAAIERKLATVRRAIGQGPRCECPGPLHRPFCPASGS